MTKAELIEQLAEFRTEQVDIEELIAYFYDSQCDKLEFYSIEELTEQIKLEIGND